MSIVARHILGLLEMGALVRSGSRNAEGAVRWLTETIHIALARLTVMIPGQAAISENDHS
jgi:hypothetical protein